jgi:ABC-type Zn uptake system ZnuABC Zn-binding protein ZnuA
MKVQWSIPRLAALLALIALVAGCASTTPGPGPQVLAAETFLADIAQNVAGDRLQVAALVPAGADPHGFQATPADVKKVADSQALIVNGAGLEDFLEDLLKNAGGQRTVIEAAAGLEMREDEGHEQAVADHDHEGDPHFWLDPISVIRYAENIRAGLSQLDPAGREIYAANAAAYVARLKELDSWIRAQVETIPAQRRLLVTNHESFGYFADRYGFTLVGAVIPSVSAGASPSAQELAQLVGRIREVGAPAIFLETGANPQLARQLGQETGVKVVTGLYTHSITDAKGPAPTYIDMMKYNVRAIVAALK